MGYGLDDQGILVWLIIRTTDIFLLCSVQTGSGGHPASCPVAIRDYFPWGGGGGVNQVRHEADHSPPPSAKDECVELYLHSPIHLHGKDNFTFYWKLSWKDERSGKKSKRRDCERKEETGDLVSMNPLSLLEHTCPRYICSVSWDTMSHKNIHSSHSSSFVKIKPERVTALKA